MIKKCYAYCNRLNGQFEMPRAYIYDKDEVVEDLIASIKASKGDLDYLLEFDLYYMGTFDSKSGAYIADKEFLISLNKELIYGNE